jgi:hypothetical protein
VTIIRDQGVAAIAPWQGNEGAHCANVPPTFPADFRYVTAGQWRLDKLFAALSPNRRKVP